MFILFHILFSKYCFWLIFLLNQLTTVDQICVGLLIGLFLSQMIFALLCLESFNINLPPLMSSPMFVTINTIFGPQWHNLSVFVENPHAGTIEYPQLEWNYPPLRMKSGIGLDTSSINYFSSRNVLAKDFVIAGSYDPSTPMHIPLCSLQSYFLSSSELDTLLSSCPYAITRKIKNTNRLFYLVTNKQVSRGVSEGFSVNWSQRMIVSVSRFGLLQSILVELSFFYQVTQWKVFLFLKI